MIYYIHHRGTPQEREETTMTATAIAIASICVIAAAIYVIVLFKTKEPELTDEQLAEMSVDREWWNAN